MTDWHRLFGIMLCDIFADSPYEVELEKDLSIQQQRLDVVVIRKLPGTFDQRLPDGFEDLADHNLISFKSYQEALDDWTIDELIGHYVSYRKHLQKSNEPILPKDHFRLFGVCARRPAQIVGQADMNEISPGVLEFPWGWRKIRVIVLRDLPEEEHNAPLHLFSADRNKVQYGQRHFKQRSPKSSTLLHQLLGRYLNEGEPMAYTLDDFYRESCERMLKEMTIEERLEGVPLEKRLEGVPLEKRLEDLSLDEIKAYLKKQTNDPPESDE